MTKNKLSFGGKNLFSLLVDLAHQNTAFIMTYYQTLFKIRRTFFRVRNPT